MGNKVRLITPFLMLLAGALASIIMYIKEYDFNSMLWTLLVVLLIFYVIGDSVRYIYALIRPRIIPKIDISGVSSDHLTDGTDSAAAMGQDGEVFNNKEGLDISEFMSQAAGEGYSDEDLAEYEDGTNYEGGDGNEYDDTQYDEYEEDYEGEEYDDGYTDGN